MMEFTYNGIVRCGFGFYNPNHAAALICALMPFLWTAWCRWKHRGARMATAGLTLLLCIALALTLSRTGVIVLLLEIVLFVFIHNRNHRAQRDAPGGTVLPAPPESNRLSRRVCLGFTAVCALVFALTGVFSRFTVDRAVTNRADIWTAGVALFASNPWQGVGLGNSGLLAAAYLLRDGIECRTLVNSHLTLLAEFGAVVGVVWFGMILMALMSGWRHPARYSSFAGLCISAFSASLFDWDLLMDFKDMGSMTALNFALSWCVFLLFITLGMRLGGGGWKRLKSHCVVWSASFFLVLGFALCGGDAPRVEQGCVRVGEDENRSLVLRGASFGIKDAATFLKSWGSESYVMPIQGLDDHLFDSLSNFRRAILFGEAHELDAKLPDIPLIYVSPPEWAAFPERTEKIFLKRYADSDAIALNAGKAQVEYY